MSELFRSALARAKNIARAPPCRREPLEKALWVSSAEKLHWSHVVSQGRQVSIHDRWPIVSSISICVYLPDTTFHRKMIHWTIACQSSWLSMYTSRPTIEVVHTAWRTSFYSLTRQTWRRWHDFIMLWLAPYFKYAEVYGDHSSFCRLCIHINHRHLLTLPTCPAKHISARRYIQADGKRLRRSGVQEPARKHAAVHYAIPWWYPHVAWFTFVFCSSNSCWIYDV